MRLQTTDAAAGCPEPYEALSEGVGVARARVEFELVWRLHMFYGDTACDEADFMESLL